MSERLPEMGEKVMVAHVDGWVSVGQRDKTGACDHWSDDGEEILEPTHWMPLPPPPTCATDGMKCSN